MLSILMQMSVHGMAGGPGEVREKSAEEKRKREIASKIVLIVCAGDCFPRQRTWTLELPAVGRRDVSWFLIVPSSASCHA